MKRLFDLVAALCGLLLSAPLLLPVMFLVWRQDGHSPFYLAPRVGRGEKKFTMVKLRSMVVDADSSGVDSTGANDMRITPIGRFIRKYKLDELTQLWNVFWGDMSLVGPRPNVKREADLYTSVEKNLLSFRPGITDLSSIVFSDEGEILEGSEDPDLEYNRLIRPWKSRLGLIYVENSSILLDVKIILITLVAILNKQKALAMVNKILVDLGAGQQLIEISRRQNKLLPHPPPGTDTIVSSR